MRRSDREVVGQENILSILDKCEILRIGLCSGNKPYIVPMNFAYELINENIFIYLHCAAEGKKLEIIAQNNNVCFEADCSYRLLKADDPCRWSAEYESVMGEGEVVIIKDELQKVRAMEIFMKRYGYPNPNFKPEELKMVTVLQIRATLITGKRNMKRS